MNKRCSHRSTPIQQTHLCIAETQPNPTQPMDRPNLWSCPVYTASPTLMRNILLTSMSSLSGIRKLVDLIVGSFLCPLQTTLKRCSQLWLWCNCDVTAMQLRRPCDDLVTTVQRAVAATLMWPRQNMSVTQWRHNFVIFLFTDVIRLKIWQHTINCLY